MPRRTVLEAIGARSVARTIHESADENIAISKEIRALAIAFTIHELADIPVPEITAFRPVDIHARTFQTAINIGAEKHFTIL